jgi:hypothetical protein
MDNPDLHEHTYCPSILAHLESAIYTRAAAGPKYPPLPPPPPLHNMILWYNIGYSTDHADVTERFYLPMFIKWHEKILTFQPVLGNPSMLE